MTNLSELKSNLEILEKSGTIDADSYAIIMTKLRNAEIEFESLEKEALVYKDNSEQLLREKLLLEQEKNILATQVTKLSNEKVELESLISIFQKSRPALSSSNLINSFAASLAEMDRGLKKTQSSVKYRVSNMNISLKTNIALEGDELRFQMPKSDDIISPENLSTIEFSLRAVPEKPDISSYMEVPNLSGLSKEDAKSMLLDAGFKVGDIQEKESDTPQGTVISQLPSENSLAEPGAEVDLIISRIFSVKVPDLVRLELQAAKELIKKSRLKLDTVKEETSGEKPGLVLAQSLSPGSEVNIDSAIALTVSTEPLEVPNLLGLELESAMQVIEKSKLQLGGIKEQFSKGKPGIVLGQSLKPGMEVEEKSKIVLIVSAEEMVGVIEKPVLKTSKKEPKSLQSRSSTSRLKR
jgi:eukaryotic-like serine/threonine-protein kinase